MSLKSRVLILIAGCCILSSFNHGNTQEPVEDDQGKHSKKELKLKVVMSYELGISFYEQQKYSEAVKEFQWVEDIAPNYKLNRDYLKLTFGKLHQQALQESHLRHKQERIRNEAKVQELFVKAKEALKQKQTREVEKYLSKIFEIVSLDPDIEGFQQFKMELMEIESEKARLKKR